MLNSRDAVVKYLALSYVVHQLTRDKIEFCAAKMGNEDCTHEAPISLAQKILPRLIESVGVCLYKGYILLRSTCS